MTTPAWIFMLAVWAVVLGMVSICFWKMLTSKRRLDSEE